MPKDKPIHEVRMGMIKVAVWKNDTQNGVLYKATFSRSYRDGNEWKTTESFGRDDLLVLAKVADRLIPGFICKARRTVTTTVAGRRSATPGVTVKDRA
jgi:hypothetical protein